MRDDFCGFLGLEKVRGESCQHCSSEIRVAHGKTVKSKFQQGQPPLNPGNLSKSNELLFKEGKQPFYAHMKAHENPNPLDIFVRY